MRSFSFLKEQAKKSQSSEDIVLLVLGPVMPTIVTILAPHIREFFLPILGATALLAVVLGRVRGPKFVALLGCYTLLGTAGVAVMAAGFFIGVGFDIFVLSTNLWGLLFFLAMLGPSAGIVIVKNRLIKPSLTAILTGLQQPPGTDIQFC